jgi:hypothetical protein
LRNLRNNIVELICAGPQNGAQAPMQDMNRIDATKALHRLLQAISKPIFAYVTY